SPPAKAAASARPVQPQVVAAPAKELQSEPDASIAPPTPTTQQQISEAAPPPPSAAEMVLIDGIPREGGVIDASQQDRESGAVDASLVYRTSDVIRADLLSGKNYRLAEYTPLIDYRFRFEIETPWGVIPAHGMAMLELRLRELN